MPEFEYKYVQDSLDKLRYGMQKAQGDMEKNEASNVIGYLTGVYHGRLSAYSSMVYHWTKIITGKECEL